MAFIKQVKKDKETTAAHLICRQLHFLQKLNSKLKHIWFICYLGKIISFNSLSLHCFCSYCSPLLGRINKNKLNVLTCDRLLYWSHGRQTIFSGAVKAGSFVMTDITLLHSAESCHQKSRHVDVSFK